MTATIGLERLPRPIAALLEEAAGNLTAIANELDELVDGDRTAIAAIAESEAEGDRITHDLIDAVRANHREGPGRVRLIILGEAVDDVVDAVDALASAWGQAPLLALTDVVLAVRDAARDSAHALVALEQPDRLTAALDRCGERDQEIRRLGRAGRAWLLVEQADPRVAVRGLVLLERAADARSAHGRLCERLQAYALA